MKNDHQLFFPPFFFNSIPKSGTHLVKQLLLGIPGIQNDELKGLYGELSYNNDAVEWLTNLKTNEFLNGHIFFSDEWTELLNKCSLKQIFLYRDPRDVVVSMAYFIPTLPEHDLYELFTSSDMTHKKRIMLLIQGIETHSQPDIGEWFDSFLKWSNHPSVLSLSFEEFVTSHSSCLASTQEMARFITEDKLPPDELEQLALIMMENLHPQSSPTFRKGKIGGWKDEFTNELKEAFKLTAGDVLISLGYEKDLNW
ncbi:sulfotransferase domain-containing protein [Heyndrickxia acidicola]|uniref:Sulfotransferase domain-containing protein n=1 Tax=Heyndrickxia acidicola TaxID=209389 RepID=A0ABU6MFK4_9BACI|nr:sulfotransferase domain-containing protein [Heyndrickxia acidicola]MED1203464.1 sulfotransferase domain-containing protein [Heyndrickxia acidicola]